MRSLIYGFGITGKSVAKYLEYIKEDFDICDRSPSDGVLSIDQLDIENYDRIIVSPGISPMDELIVKARSNDVVITSELQMAYDLLKHYNNKFIAITGTNGKSTTASLIYYLIKKSCNKDVFLTGNIGVPLIEKVFDTPENSYFVIEVSSYQAEYLFDFSPDVLLLLNLSPDHLARHRNMKAYHDAKTGLIKVMKKDSTVLFNEKDFDISEYEKPIKKIFKKDFYIKDRDFYYDNKIKYKDIYWRLPGKHNIDNICFSLACLDALGISNNKVKEALADFASLEHRIEKIYDEKGLSIYNDSKATTFESTLAAVSSFDRGIHLILCGKLKEGMDIDRLLKRLVEFENIDNIIILGDVNNEVGYKDDEKIITFRGKWEDFFKDYLKRIGKGVLLFSPGMPSFDMFKNFEERGAFFKKVIRDLINNK